MSHSNESAAMLLEENYQLIKELEMGQGVLDLACGNGRNGLLLTRNRIPVTFADNNESAIESVENHLAMRNLKGKCWLIDFEEDNSQALKGKCFDAMLVFNYLHRPLLSAIKQAIRAGGLLFYETFTTEQRQFGRPSSADFLLEPSELHDCFRDWEIIHYFEGELQQPQRAVANMIARRPLGV